MSNNVFFGNYDLNCFEITFKHKISTCYYEKPFKVPNGVTAFICNDIKDVTKVNFSPIKNNIVPSHTPVFLQSKEIKTYRFWFDETNTDKAPEPNYLYGANKDINIFVTFPKDKYNVYGFTHDGDSGNVSLFIPSENAKLPAHKAILVIPK